MDEQATTSKVLLALDRRGIAVATLNRPERGNAYDGEVLDLLARALRALGQERSVRALVIRGAGKHFQTGADLAWLERSAAAGPGGAYAAAMATTRAMQLLHEFPKPTIALVHGVCLGGGCGILCSVDIALASRDARFAISEVCVGVSPSPIAREVVQAIGARQARRYALTGEEFDAAEALRIGLIHEALPPERLEARLEEVLEAILHAAPEAVSGTKRALLAANGLAASEAQLAELAEESVRQRSSAEGREGIAAARGKRTPNWVVQAE